MKRLCKKIIYRLIPWCFLYPFFKIVGKLEVRGIENLAGKGGLLIASNHVSNIDPPLLATIIPGGCIFMAKHGLFDIPILKHLISYYAFPLNREKPGASAIKTALARLADGETVVIFPEGKRGKGDTLLTPKNGIGMIAFISKKRVVPTLVEGTDKLLPPDKLIPRPAKTRVTFGNTLDLSREGSDYSLISRKIGESIEGLRQK